MLAAQRLQRFSSVYGYHITYVLFPLTVIGRIVFGIVWLDAQYMICTSMMGLATAAMRPHMRVYMHLNVQASARKHAEYILLKFVFDDFSRGCRYK